MAPKGLCLRVALRWVWALPLAVVAACGGPDFTSPRLLLERMRMHNQHRLSRRTGL